MVLAQQVLLPWCGSLVVLLIRAVCCPIALRLKWKTSYRPAADRVGGRSNGRVGTVNLCFTQFAALWYGIAPP